VAVGKVELALALGEELLVLDEVGVVVDESLLERVRSVGR